MKWYGLSINISITFGLTSITLISTEIIPLEENGKEGMLADENWRWVFGCSILVNILSILIVLFIFPNPSLKDHLRTLNDEDSIKELSKIYITDDH